MTACGGGYVHQSRGARHSFQRGDPEKALKWYQQQKPPHRDRLLYLMDQAVILHTAGRYQESLKTFEEAIRLSEAMNSPQVLAKTASLVTNDNLIPYKGEDFERLLMHLFQVLNYLGLGEPDEALVEVRRVHTKFSDFFKDNSKSYLRNAFATYLSGLVWEANGKLNDAYIDYKTTQKIVPSFPSLPQDLLKGATLFGFLNEKARWQKLFRQDYRPLPPDQGEVILLIEEGVVPEKESTEEEINLQVLPLPRYPKDLKNPVLVSVFRGASPKGASPKGVSPTDKTELAQTTPLYRVDEAAKKTLADQKGGMIARGLARLAVKEGAAVAVGTKVDRDLGIFLGVLVLATNRADLRSWLTLPRSFQVARFALPEGTYDLKLSWPGGSKSIPTMAVKARKKTFVIQRIFD
ncbi:MAG: hypothetical protein HYS22_04050 [Deltaproteobacteria bacterium]|nr:hypothetical protein [Deltaproteobacteria bacterium]